MEWLKNFRVQANQTLAEVAVKAGISESYYCQIENGVRNAPVHTAKKIAAVLGFDWQKFFEDEVEQKENPA